MDIGINRLLAMFIGGVVLIEVIMRYSDHFGHLLRFIWKLFQRNSEKDST